ncbi:MAG: Ig-like domain-containing protein, partial [Treponema sp.]|nr:Ig-like domain-containing protein [Treponema sp.]
MKKSLSVILSVIAILLASCNNWMKDDDFYDKIETDVKIANASSVSVYVRYANSKMGTTDPSGTITLKKGIPSELNAVTNDDYGFVKWVAFSTGDFPANKQHSDLFYDNAEKYEETYKPLEIPSSEVSFEDPANPSTKVTINTTRSDIFITPLVAKRPTVVTSVPSNGRSDVVRNTSIRILFSKKIDPASLRDEFGNSNIVVTSGSAVLTETSGDLSAKDVTENCTITLGKTGKMLTIAPKSGFYFDNNSQITVNIYEDVCDSDGYGMNGKYSFSFTTGVKLDSLAPYIKELWASPDADFSENHRFEQYKYMGENETVVPVYKTEADNATNNISAYVSGGASYYTAGKKQILTQRVKDFLNIYVQAADIAGSGGNVTVDQNTTSESDVALVQIRACLYIDKDGNAVTTSADAFADNTKVSSSYYIETKDIGYAPGLKDSECKVQSTFEDVFPSRSGGTLFTYDLSSLPDGLIKIDIWAVDMVGNSGETESYVQSNYNNNYRSIFVVKDSTKPDAAANKVHVVPTGSASAYDYYNATTYAGIKISGNTSIADAGNANLSSLNSKMKWIVKPTADTSWVNTISPNDNGWKFVTEDYSGFPIPASDGPVTLTYALMDDLGNISDAVQLDAIKYDGTNPAFSNLSFVADAGSTDGIVSNSYLNTQTLVIPLVEQTSGIKSLEFEIKQNGVTGYGATVADKSKLTVTIGDSTTAFTAYTTSGNTLTFDTPQTGFNSQIKIKGLTLFGSDAEGDYEVNVKVKDAANNETTTSATQKTNAYIDPVAPVVNQIYIPNLREGIWFSDSTSEYWADYTALTTKDSNNTDLTIPRTDIYVKFTEATSGAKVFDFGGSTVKLTTDSQIYAVDSSTWAAAGSPLEREVSTSNNTITIKNRNDTVKNQNGFAAVKITNVELAASTASGGSQVAVKINDTATNISDANTATPAVKDAFTTITSKEGSVALDGISKFRYDNLAPATSTFTISDKETETNCLDAQAGFTNNEVVNAKISIETSSAGSGIYSLTIDGAAEFDSATTIQSTDGSDTIDYTFDVSSDKKTVTFKKNGKHALIQKSENSTIELIINNLKLTDPTTDGDKKVIIKSGQLSGVKNSGSSYTIVLDKTPPVWGGNGFYSKYDTRITSESVWPHPVNGEKNYGVTFGNDEDNVYFYRKSSINVASDVFDKNYCNTRWKLTSNNDIGDSVNAYGSVTGKWDVFGYDKAGNTTSVKSMHVVEDNSFASDVSDIDNYMTIVPPDSNSRFYINGTLIPHNFDSGTYNFRGNTTENMAPVYSADYVIRQTDNPYVIKIKLGSGLSSQDTLLNGQTATDKDQYSGLEVSDSASPLEYYSVSHWYYAYRGFTNDIYTNADSTPFGSWMPGGCEYLSWHEYKKNSIQNNNNQKYKDGYQTQTKEYYIYSYVDSSGDIVIELPDYDCPPLTLILKDGCGNITERLIKPTSFTGDNTTVSWVIDGEVGLPSYNNVDSTAWNNTNYLSTPNNSEVAFYRLNSESKTNLVEFGGTNGFSDTVRFSGIANSAEGSEDAYSMRSRIIVWPASASTEPQQSDFNLPSGSTNSSKWFYMKERLNNGNFNLQNELPKYNSVDANGEGVAYKLYYIIEDYLGNCEIRQLKRSSSVELWLYDNTPPKLEVKEAVNVNNVDGKNYYSDFSSVKYSIEDKLSGIQHNGSNSYTYSSFTSRVQLYPQTGLTDYPLSGKTPDSNGKISISGVKDWAENEATSVGLENAGSNIWVYQPDAPAFDSSPVQIKAVNPPSGKRFNTGSSNGAWYIDSSRWITHIELKMTMDDSEPLLGWIIKNDDSVPENKIYTVADTQSQNGNPAVLTPIPHSGKVYTYKIDKTKKSNNQTVDDTNTTWNNYFNKKPLKFYAVNRAGIINTEPIVINFEELPVPALDGSLEYSDVIKYPSSDSTDNYIKSASKVIFKTKENPDKCTIFVGTESVTFTLSTYLNTSTGKYEIPLGTDAKLKAASGAALKLVLSITGGEDSDEIELKGPANVNKWTFDETSPTISLGSVKTVKNPNNEPALKNQFDDSDETFYIEGNNAIIEFNTSATDIAKWQKKLSTQTDYEDIDNTSMNGNALTLTVTNATYNFRAIDKAGNASSAVTVEIKKDVSVPLVNSFSYELRKGDAKATTGTYTDNNGTIVYNKTEVNKIYLNLTGISDPDGNGLHFFNNDTALTTTTSDNVTYATISLSLADAASATYAITVKDDVGKSTAIKTFTVTADDTTPSISISSVQSKTSGGTYDGYLSSGVYYLCRKNAIITLSSAAQDIATYQVNINDAGWNDITPENGVYTFSCEGITTATTYVFHAIDNVGHVSPSVSAKIIYDGAGPTGSVTHTIKTSSGIATLANPAANPIVIGDYTASGPDADGVITITYNSNVKTIVFNDSGVSDAGAGYTSGTLFYKKGYNGSATEITDKTLSLENDMGTDIYEIIAKDNTTGNSGTVGKYKFVKDTTGPAINTGVYEVDWNGRKVNQVNGYTSTIGTIPYAKWVSKDQRKRASYYTSGTKLMFAKTAIPGAIQYQMVQTVTTGNTKTTDGYTATAGNTWQNMVVSDDGNNFVFALPDIHTPYTRLSLFFRDELGNVSDAYYLGNNTNNQQGIQWWIIGGAISAGDITITSITYNNNGTVTNGWGGKQHDYTVTLTLPVGTLIKSVFLVPKPGNANTGVVFATNLPQGVNTSLQFSGYGTETDVVNNNGNKEGVKDNYDSEGFLVLPSSSESETGTITMIIYPHDVEDADKGNILVKFNGENIDATGVSAQIFGDGGNGGGNGGNGNRFSTTFTPGSFDTSAIAGSRDLAATQISSIGRGIIMNK